MEEAAVAVAGIEKLWGEMSEDRSRIYMEVILDLPFDLTVRCVRALMGSRATMPAPAVIRREVMREAGLLPPTVDLALMQAEMWLGYQRSMGFVNGSGWQPDEPVVHPAVVRSCRGLDGGHGSWSSTFRSTYQTIIASAESDMLASDFGLASGAVASIGAGS